jgi:molecular chaperone GrpE
MDDNEKTATNGGAPQGEAQEDEGALPAPVEPELAPVGSATVLGGEAVEPALEEKLANEVTELKDRLLRALAETENLRKRKEREVEETGKYAIASFARGLLAVSDNLRRALDSIPPEARSENGLLKTIAEGVELTERELLALFERHGIRKIEPLGEPFDYNLHQAMLEIPCTGKPAGTVVEVMQVGYVLGERLLRPALVAVAKEGGAEGESTVEPGGKLDTRA